MRIGILGWDSTHAPILSKFLLEWREQLGPDRAGLSLYLLSSDSTLPSSKIEGVELLERSQFFGLVDIIFLCHRFTLDRISCFFDICSGSRQKKVFFDKAIAENCQQLISVYDVAVENEIEIISSSVLRFVDLPFRIVGSKQSKEVTNWSIHVSSNGRDLGDDPRLFNKFFYGVHAADLAYELFVKTHPDNSNCFQPWEENRFNLVFEDEMEIYKITGWNNSLSVCDHDIDIDNKSYFRMLSFVINATQVENSTFNRASFMIDLVNRSSSSEI